MPLPLRPPSKLLWAAELPRAAGSVVRLLAARGSLATAPRGVGRPVMLLPGLFNTDRSNAVLRRYLTAQGHDAHGWRLGRNRGARTIGADAVRLIDRVAALADTTGQPVALVGVSLGGMIARLVAQQRPELMRQVVTIASPYNGDARATNVWRAFEWMTGERLRDPAVVARSALLAQPLPVPATAIWSRSDGLVNGMLCHTPDEPNCRAVEIRSSHLGVQVRPDVLRIVAEALAERQ